MSAYQPKTGEKCHCKCGIQRDNCPACEGTGWVIDFAAIRARHASPPSKLCNLPDSEFSTGGQIDRMAREAGYSSGRSLVNELSLWGATVGEVVTMLKEQGARPMEDDSEPVGSGELSSES